MADAIERRWVRAEVDEVAAAALGVALALPLRIARLLVARGVSEVEAASRFLSPRLADLPDPSSMKDLDLAALRVADAIARGERVALYGDYDVDGVTSTTLLASFLRGEGLVARTYIPKRLTEGYGLNQDAVATLAAEGTRLLITLDCGITAAEEIARANSSGIDCVVVDHHRCPPALPPAYATLNPHQPGCGYPDKGLAAVGVCFNLIAGVRRVLRARGAYASREEPNLKRLLDLVALGTIADMVPLTGVNRTLAWYGIEELRSARRPGVRALLEVAGVKPHRCSGSDVGFRLGPRINASGRLADASTGVRMLLAERIEEARPLAEALDHANGLRQRVEAEVLQMAVAAVELLAEVPDAIVLQDDRWHPGVVGIVAARLVERYGRPVILVGEGGRGSARTARGLHLYDAIAGASEHLFKFGGHRAAAGLTVESAKFPLFREAFLAQVRGDPGLDAGAATLVYDDELAPEEVDDACVDAIARLQPFGNGNPEPLFRAIDARIRTARVVGKGHLKLRLAEGSGGGGLDGIAFSRGELAPELTPGRAVELAFHVERSEFSGVPQLELRVREIRIKP